jgi:hypothetical protein
MHTRQYVLLSPKNLKQGGYIWESKYAPKLGPEFFVDVLIHEHQTAIRAMSFPALWTTFLSEKKTNDFFLAFTH